MELIIVIPVYLELGFISQTIESILALESKAGELEVIFVLNDHENSSETVIKEQKKTFELIQKLTSVDSNIEFQSIVLSKIKHKVAGVGHARKVGMDEAVRRFSEIEQDGIIACLDSDCTILGNYIHAIKSGFNAHPKLGAASIHFEHNLNQTNHKAIVSYELHLRYFIDAQRMIGLPFAYQTIGSSMAVRTSAYAKMGGMNQRKAGEDFYFLQKFVAVNQLFEINNTTVIPSDRESSRVPFGTGKAVRQMNQERIDFKTYNFESFKVIQVLVNHLQALAETQITTAELLTKLHPAFQRFLMDNGFESKVAEIGKQTTTSKLFEKRFYQWFNAFLFMKCLHHLRDNGFENIKVQEQVSAYCSSYYSMHLESEKELLLWFRRKQVTDFSYSIS